jgi:hypothetical protein
MSESLWTETLKRILCGTFLAHRHVQKMPGNSVREREARAAEFTRSMRIVHMEEWRPCFPFNEGRAYTR